MLSVQTEPHCDYWAEYKMPQLCRNRIDSICKSILAYGEKTAYQEIYDAIYELVQAQIEEEQQDDYFI